MPKLTSSPRVRASMKPTMRKVKVDGLTFVSFSKGGDAFLRALQKAAKPVKKPRPVKKA